MGLSGRLNARHACPAGRRNGMRMLECVRNALVIAPHPDDEVLGCGGTIARLTGGGAQVHVAIVTRAGADRFDPELADTGVAEARAAHACLGVADTHFLKFPAAGLDRSEEHTSELQSLMRISYAVFCLNKKNKKP